MTNKPEPIWIDAEENECPIEIYLEPGYARECAAIGLQRTRRRAAKLIAELEDALKRVAPVTDEISDLAEGIRFEWEQTERLAILLVEARPPPRP